MAAKPDKPPSFNKLWRNLDRALSMPVFNKFEIALMQVARELSYTASVVDGSGRAKPFRIFASKLAARRGLCREAVSRAITGLLKDNVWKGTRDCCRINKDYRSWTGKHALTADQIRECDDALDYPVTNCGEVVAGGPNDAKDSSIDTELPCDPPVTVVTRESQNCDSGVTTRNGSVTWESQVCDLGVTSCDSGVTASTSPPTPPYSERAREEERERERVGLASQTSEREADSVPMTVEELLAAVDFVFQRPAVTAEVRANLGSIIQRLGDRLDCFLAGLKQAKRSRTEIRDIIGFAIYQGLNYKRTGIPPEPMKYIPDSVKPSKAVPISYDSILAELEN